MASLRTRDADKASFHSCVPDLIIVIVYYRWFVESRLVLILYGLGRKPEFPRSLATSVAVIVDAGQRSKTTPNQKFYYPSEIFGKDAD